MKHSTDRILTTHAGSLPRPDALREAWAKPGTSEAEIDTLLKSAVADVVKAQQAVAVDIPNDGEFGKPMRAATDLAAWGTYIFGRLSGFGPTPAGAGAPDRAQTRRSRCASSACAGSSASSPNFMPQGAGVPSTASRPTCTGPIAYTGASSL